MPRLRRALVAPLALAVLLPLTGCGGGAATSSGSSGGPLAVTVSFYPMQYLAERIGGSHVRVTDLTKPGAEPHDLELTPRDVAGLTKADLVVQVKGFQPAVDDAVTTTQPRHLLDVAGPADMDLTYTPIEDGESEAEQAGSRDPHFWLDPVRYRAVADALAAQLERQDPAHAADYRAAATRLDADLQALDRQYRAALATCTNTDVVTSHNAFGYLARRYGLTQVGITGLSPEGEPSAKQLASVADFVRAHHVRTVYTETLVSPALADTVAAETGARTAVLDPIEGIGARSQGRDYLQVMRANLRNLQTGQPCP